MSEIWHHGIKGQRWGVKNGPPYPLDAETAGRVRMHALHGDYDKNDRDWYGSVSQKKMSEHSVEELSKLKKLNHEPTDDDLYAINHSDDDSVGRHFNCFNCAAAADMMLRGYDVCARPAKNGSNVGAIESYYENGKLSRLKFDDDEPEFDPPIKSSNLLLNEKQRIEYEKKLEEYYAKYEKQYGEYIDKSKSMLTDQLKAQGDGSWGILVLGFKMNKNPSLPTTAFHAINYKVDNGKVQYADTQGRYSHGFTDYIPIDYDYNVNPREVYYMQTNLLQPSSSMTANGIYSRKGDA